MSAPAQRADQEPRYIDVPRHVARAARLKVKLRRQLGLPVKASTVRIANLLPDDR
jgi:hypothetical protein